MANCDLETSLFVCMHLCVAYIYKSGVGKYTRTVLGLFALH